MARKEFLAPEYPASKCPDKHLHTESPDGYLAWHAWAEKMSKTHKQERCPTCGCWVMWVKKKSKCYCGAVLPEGWEGDICDSCHYEQYAASQLRKESARLKIKAKANVEHGSSITLNPCSTIEESIK